MNFDDLTHDGQVALAAWAVLFVSEPPAAAGDEIAGLSCEYTRAVGAIATTVGLHARKRRNKMRRHDVTARSAIRKSKPPTPRKKAAR